MRALVTAASRHEATWEIAEEVTDVAEIVLGHVHDTRTSGDPGCSDRRLGIRAGRPQFAFHHVQEAAIEQRRSQVTRACARLLVFFGQIRQHLDGLVQRGHRIGVGTASQHHAASGQHRRQPLLVDDQHVIEQPQSGARVADLGPEAGKRDQYLRMDSGISRGLGPAQRPLAHSDRGRGFALITELQRATPQIHGNMW